VPLSTADREDVGSSFKDLVQLLEDEKISAVPVLDVHDELRCGWNDTTRTRQTEIFG
jgi:hypothetical protein